MNLIRIATVSFVVTSVAVAQPRLKVRAPSSYQVGDVVSAGTVLLDREMQTVRLADLLDSRTQVAVLVIFGGGASRPAGAEPLRGGIWCEDSYDDLSIQRALVHQFTDRPVQFIPVAVPPVYHHQFGYPKGVFLEHSDNHPAYLKAARSFIEATEELRRADMIPYQTIYYDPKFRLAQNRKERDLGPEFGQIFDWQGKLKWQLDPRKYGTPTIWLLDGQGRILSEPFFGNEYDGDPPQINYGFHDLRKRIEQFLE